MTEPTEVPKGRSLDCSSCRLFDDVPGSPTGWCRRYAPRPSNGSGDMYDTEWPSVAPYDWCGEHEPQEPRHD